MQLIEVENQINMQYLTQLLQNEDFDIKQYKYRSNLWNADNLNSQELLSLYRQFQFYDSAKKQAILRELNPEAQGASSGLKAAQPAHPHDVSRHKRNASSDLSYLSMNSLSYKDQPLNGEEQFVELQIVGDGEEEAVIKRNNSDGNLQDDKGGSGRQLGVGVVAQIQPYRARAARKPVDDPYTVKIILSDMDEIYFPATMQRYPFKHKVYDFTDHSDVISKGILRRIIFLSISGYIGFDSSERTELIKGAFLLEFDAFFEYLMKPTICQILKFDQQDDVLEVLAFMWQVNIRRSMKYYDFVVKIATINSSFYKKDIGISPKVLNLDLSTMETQFLPLIQRILESDKNINMKKVHTILKQIIEYYEIHNAKHIVYPFIQEQPEQNISQSIEEKYQNLLKEFDCPICFMPYENCYTSKCGHSYCRTCIVTSVIKFGNCPVCQQNITQDDLFRNFHMNEIKTIAYQEKEASKTQEINRQKHMNSFKEKFQQIMQSNIINSLQAQKDKKSSNNEGIQSYESIQKLKKQIQYLVNITFDQLMDSCNIES